MCVGSRQRRENKYPDGTDHQIEFRTPHENVDDQANEGHMPPAHGEPQGITVGSDGNLWFADYYANTVGNVTSGVSLHK